MRNDISVTTLTPHKAGHSEYIEVMWIECYFRNTFYYIVGCYHPPRPRYQYIVLMTELSRDIELISWRPLKSGFLPAVIVLARDFNHFDT